MSQNSRKRFIFIGGVPVFDYMVSVRMEDINRATSNNVFIVGSRILLPVGTIFELKAQGRDQIFYLNPMANVEIQNLQDKLYYAMEFGGKHPEQREFRLRVEKSEAFSELHAQFPTLIRTEDDLKIVEVRDPAQLHLGGNNKNIIEEIKTLYDSPELAGCAERISFEHHFFFDVDNAKFPMVAELYDRLGVSMGKREDLHVEGLVPRIGYVLTIVADDGSPMDRIILSNKTNEESIPSDQLTRTYFGLEHTLRRDADFAETHLVINSMTNQEEMRFLVRLLQTAHASGVVTYLCPTLTLLTCMDRLIERKFYAVQEERFYGYKRDFVYSAILPYVKHIVLNRDELALLDNSVAKRGIDATATYLAHQMNRGRGGETLDGGHVVVTGGSKGARYTEILRPERAKGFWSKARLAEDKAVRFADRRIVCGDDYLTTFTSTLGAGDVFTGVFIGLVAIGWDGGHALRAATLGAQHFIQNRAKPKIRDMIAMDEEHIRLGTETELVDVISHHVDDSGDPTRYGTIADTVITVTTKQLQHPFREVLDVARTLAAGRLEAPGRAR
ncbi:MAG: carbohydrate kinase family protein [Deltaproteobacteria bacterium]|nr:carbohydrate kinase family protein [Deltaproteobacteria bacterium]